jgi:hypothetical protein
MTAQVMSAISLPDLISVPVIGTVLGIAVDTFECTFGYPPAISDSGLVVLGASIVLRLDYLNLGVLELASLEVSLEYHHQNDPLGPGYEQKAFSITSLLADGTLTASVSYDSHAGTLTAGLKGVQSVHAESHAEAHAEVHDGVHAGAGAVAGIQADIHAGVTAGVHAVAFSRQVCIYWLWKHCLFRRDCLWRERRTIYS